LSIKEGGKRRLSSSGRELKKRKDGNFKRKKRGRKSKKGSRPRLSLQSRRGKKRARHRGEGKKMPGKKRIYLREAVQAITAEGDMARKRALNTEGGPSQQYTELDGVNTRDSH